MSNSSRTVAKSESGRVLPRRIFDDILALANSLLEDECPIADFEDWLFPIDDTLLELKLWEEKVGVEQGLLEKVVRYEDLCFVVGQILHDVITPLQVIKKSCENPEIHTSLEGQATISTAIDQFQSSTSILVDTVASTLIETVELFQECRANAKEQSLVHNDKPMEKITDSPYEVNHHNRQFPTSDKTAEGQQKRVSGIPNQEPLPTMKTSFKAFLEVLKEMSPREGQAIRFGELPILREQLLMGIHLSQKRGADEVGDDSVYTEDEVTAVAVTLARFHDAWLETFWTTPPTASDAKPKINCVPYVAKIWLILHEMGKEYLLDYFCEGEKTDQSLPLDLLTLETIFPPDLIEDASVFARVQFRVVPRPQRFLGSEVRGSRDLPPSDEQHIKRGSNKNLGVGQTPRGEFGRAYHVSKGKVGDCESILGPYFPTTRDQHSEKPLRPAIRLAENEDVPSIHEFSNPLVNYDSQDEEEASDLKLLWDRVMDEGDYTNTSTYTKVEVLLLCWAESCDDLTAKKEVEDLKATFENDFNYHATIEYLDITLEQRIQVRVNAKVAAFVCAHDGPDTLLIVYYAGHGRPGQKYGNLELFGQTSPNDDPQRRLDVLVWNKAEKLLSIAEADVLEIFDCCYAGQLGIRTKGTRSFEFLAATEEMGTTKVPGQDSFTSALIWALKSLVKEKENGRFTTVQLRNKIKVDAPDFPEDQNPVLVPRLKQPSTVYIMLHPLQKEGLNEQGLVNRLSRKKAASLDPFKQHTMTLHFDFGDKPSQIHIETIGRELNGVFRRINSGVSRIRWGGGKQSMVALAAKSFQDILKKNRRANLRLHEVIPASTSPYTQLPENALDPLTPNSSDQHSPRSAEPAAKGSQGFSSADTGTASLIRSLDSNDDGDGQTQEPRGRRKRRRVESHTESA